MQSVKTRGAKSCMLYWSTAVLFEDATGFLHGSGRGDALIGIETLNSAIADELIEEVRHATDFEDDVGLFG
jgi:hypothetical protein